MFTSTSGCAWKLVLGLGLALGLGASYVAAEDCDPTSEQRIAFGQAYVDDYPEFRDMIAQGDATGPIDYLMGRLVDGSRPAAIRRFILSMQNAIAVLTDTQNSDEWLLAFSPSFTDDANSLLDKVDQLHRQISNIVAALMRCSDPTKPR